jgi:O-antigen/teichoic acid export membrane protein
MTSSRVNALANYIGTGVSFGLNLIFAGVYFTILGASNYGLIAVAQSLQMLMQAGDIGLSASVNRELARPLSTLRQSHLLILRTLGLLNAAMAAVVASIVWIATPGLIRNWINVSEFDATAATSCLRVAVVMLFFQATASFYTSALMGLQRQILANKINTAFHILRHFGTWGMLVSVGPSVLVFFVTQACVTACCATSLFFAANMAANAPEEKAWFSRGVLSRCWGFGLASAGTNIIGMFVSQLDRLILAKYLTLSEYGLYSLAATIASYASRAVVPLQAALYPRFIHLVETRDRRRLELLYLRAQSFAGSLAMPAALCLIFYPGKVLGVFTGTHAIEHSALIVLAMLAAGSAMAVCSNMAYSLQQAHGNQLFAFKLSVLCLFLYSPALWLAAGRWGALGAAACGLALNTVNFILFPTYTTIKYMPAVGLAPYRLGFLYPLLLSSLAFIATHLLLPNRSPYIPDLVFCAIVTAAAYGMVSICYYRRVSG